MNATEKKIRSGTLALPYLERWRMYRLLKRNELASRSDVSVATILKIEHKNVLGARIATVIKLAKGLGITPDELLYSTPPYFQKQFTA